MSCRLIPLEQPPVGDDRALREWLTRMMILINAALSERECVGEGSSDCYCMVLCDGEPLEYLCSTYEDTLVGIINGKSDGGVWPATRQSSGEAALDVSIHGNHMSLRGTPNVQEASSMDNCTPWSSSFDPSEGMDVDPASFCSGTDAASGSYGGIFLKQGANTVTMASQQMGQSQSNNTIQLQALGSTTLGINLEQSIGDIPVEPVTVPSGWWRIVLNYDFPDVDTCNWTVYVNGVATSGQFLLTGSNTITPGGDMRIGFLGGQGTGIFNMAWASREHMTVGEVVALESAWAQTQSDYEDPNPIDPSVPEVGDVLQYAGVQNGKNVWCPITIKGYGGIHLNTPYVIPVVDSTYTQLDADNGSVQQPVNVTQDIVNNGVGMNLEGVWSMDFFLEITYDTNNKDRQLEIRFHDAVTGGIVGIPATVTLGRDQFGEVLSGNVMGEVPTNLVGNPIGLQIGGVTFSDDGLPTTVTNMSVNNYAFTVNLLAAVAIP